MAKRLSNEEKLELMLEYEKETGEKIKANTEYKGYQIGHIRNNLRQAYFNGTLKMEADLLKRFIQSGIIKEGKERKKKATTQEKYNFVMKMVGKSEEELQSVKMENGASFTAVRNSLQSSYNNGKLDLTPEQIENLIKAGFLNYSKEEQEEAMKKYGIPARYVQDIIRKYGSYETFLEKYKNKEIDYNFGDDVFCGARCVALSDEDLTAVQKLAYYNLVRAIRGNTPWEPLAYIDINDLENTLEEKLSEIEIQTIKLRFGFDGKKHSLEECAKTMGITFQRVRLIEQKALRRLLAPNIARRFFGIGKRDEESLEKYRTEYNAIEDYIKDFNTIRKFITDEEGNLRPDITDTALTELGVSGRIFSDGIIANRTMEDLMESAKPEKREISEEVLRTPIESLDLSIRSINGLKRNEIDTISDLLKYSERELLNKRYLGAKSVREIVTSLRNMGLSCRVDETRIRRWRYDWTRK